MPKKLRIFQVISAKANSGIAGNLTWYRNLHEPLVEMGHGVVLFSADEGELAMARKDKKLRADFSQRLLDKFRQEHIRKPFDLFFAYLKEGVVEPGAIKEIGKTGVPTCNFSCNNTHQFYLVEQLSPQFDYNLHSEKDAREKFLKIGANPLWWPMASNPKYFKPENHERTIDVSFVGGNYGLRARYIKYLLQKGVNAHAYGPGWQGGAKTPFRSAAKRYLYIMQSLFSRQIKDQARASAELADHDLRRSLSKLFPSNVHPPVSDAELISLYSKSKISLGILEVYDNHDPSSGVLRHLHLRDFEAPMCGALYCTGYTEELAEMFEPGEEILTYRDEGELLDKVKYYLKHEGEGENIRLAGRQRALKDHSYQRRFDQLFEKIGLK
ncbi:MAG: glycosyltransferase family 1 protein [Deltaproteobacteria bacterium]|nr:glycosyltransferase family 1 protein [Deltaproteobacteria bacterium]